MRAIMKQQLQELILSSLQQLGLETILQEKTLQIQIERTKNQAHGDFATNIALMLSKQAQKNPRQLAEEIIDALPKSKIISKAEIAGPGFINFFLNKASQFEVVKTILNEGDNFGRCDFGQGQKVHVEFVSANPTGPLHVGHGRGAAYGSVLADILDAVGFKAYREYYVNDAGRQMNILAASVWLRYLELQGEKFSFPSNGYKGEYVIDIAKEVQSAFRDNLVRKGEDVFSNVPADDDGNGNGDKEAHIDALIKNSQGLLGEHYRLVFDIATETILKDIRNDLSEFKVEYQNWFSEKSLMDNGAIAHGLEKLDELGFIYEKNAAKWFKSTEFGDDKDRVLQRDDGRTTYFASDVAYHVNKVERGFSYVIDVLGADHHGYVARVRASMRALGVDDKHFRVPLVQFASLYRDGKKVQMSTRSGSFVTLRELRDEVGVDAARYFYIMRKAEQHMDFDLDLAKSKSNENPVYYIQYAHARIQSVFAKLTEQSKVFDMNIGFENLDKLDSEHEIELLKRLPRYSEVVLNAAKNLEPHLLANYLKDLAKDLHAYYNAAKFIIDDNELSQARLCLIKAVKQVLINGLGILKVSAPDKM